MAVTRFALIESNEALAMAPTGAKAIVRGTPVDPITLSTGSGRCGWRNYASGGGSSDPNFNTPLTYGNWIAVVKPDYRGDHQALVYLSPSADRDHPTNWADAGVKFKNFTNIEGGETCTETIGGEVKTFKKFQLDSDDA